MKPLCCFVVSYFVSKIKFKFMLDVITGSKPNNELNT